MDIRLLQAIVVATALGLLLWQTTVRHKQTVHIVFAVFCGSLAMMMAKRLGADALGPYQYLLGLGACATCNGYWLVARALFRDSNAVAGRHLLMAGSVALLLMSDQGLSWLATVANQPTPLLLPTQSALNALMGLLSSCLLVLACWEGYRGWSGASRTDRQQRLLFLGAYSIAVLGTTVAKAASATMTDPHSRSPMIETVIALASLLMLLVTQVLITWRRQTTDAARASTTVNKAIAIASVARETTATLAAAVTAMATTTTSSDATANKTETEIGTETAPETVTRKASTTKPDSTAAATRDGDDALAAQIHTALYAEQLYLQPDLKVAELARRFAVPEYRISRAIHHQFAARNFNQLINALRIRHAQTLLADPATQFWPVLVIGLESGFASVGPFNRAFKAIAGCTPGEYRQRLRQPSISEHSVATTPAPEPLALG